MRRLWALAALFPALAAARPFEGLSRRDQVALLYRPQFQFTRDGEPIASVGLVTGASEASFRGRAGLRLLPAGEDGVELPVAPGETVRVRVAGSHPAVATYWTTVRTRGCGAQRTARILASWRERGFRPRLFEVGSVLGLEGEVLDNRVTVVGLLERTSRAEAAREAQRLSHEIRMPVEVYEALRSYPTGMLEILAADGTVRARVRDLLWIVTEKREVIEVGGRTYRGTLYATLDRKGRLAVANILPVEDMLLGVVPSEIFPRAPLAALRAQAVTARGEILAKIGTRHFADPFRICATEHCQVYKGHGQEHARTSRGVRETRGEILWGRGALVDTVYSAICGGHTEDNDAVWQSSRDPHLRGRPDGADPRGDLSDEADLRQFLTRKSQAYCARAGPGGESRFRWRRAFRQAEIAALVARTRDIGAIRAVEIVGRGVSGRVTAVRIHGQGGDLVVRREYPIRKLLGNLPSGMFVVDASRGEIPEHFVLRGGGWGHGVGMCQMGAVGMARAGKSHREILRHYYRQSRVRKLY
jgi:SpoIID/LytB domain protein